MSDTKYGAVNTGGDAEKASGFEKKKKCNDSFFAFLFVAHLVAIAVVFFNYKSEDEALVYWAPKGVYKFVGIIGLTAIVLSTLALGFMSAFADELVQIALVSTLAATIAVIVRGLTAGKMWMAYVGGGAFVIVGVFTWCIWDRIQFASANLRTAISAIRTNFGLVIVSYLWEVVAFGWTLVWLNATGAAMNTIGAGMLFVYLLSFFWTQQVINNIQHVVVASVLGTWWYNPILANEFWDDGLNSALFRALSYNFGSICLGSLLAGIVQALQYLLHMSESNDYLSWITCMLRCCLRCVQNVIEYFNKWAFTYVGIHGDSYVESGKKVLSLFRERGWSSIITDHIADLVMFFMTFAIALLTGLTGWGLVTFDDDIFVELGIDADKDDLAGFVSGFLIGYLLASIMMCVVSSAINAVIVCFAEAPAVFKENYPTQCDEMLTAWKEAYPDECADDFDAVA